MVRYTLLPAHDTRLNGLSRAITHDEIGGTSIQTLLESMASIAMAQRDAKHPNRPTLVGLAAPQIGEFVRVILFDMTASGTKPNFKPDIRFVINPEIRHASQERELGREGCYSTGSIRAVVRRHTALKVSGMDQHGSPVEFELRGFQARIVQHEVDHLNGIRCPDRIESPAHLHTVLDDEFQEYREHWQDWHRTYPITEWLEIKNGAHAKISV